MTGQQEKEYAEFQSRVKVRDAAMARSGEMRMFADTHYPGPNPKSVRKVVQICDKEGILCALCDDGTMWGKESAFSPTFEWRKISNIPQPE